jgi:dihydroorotate dehydrogenase electron transfer subunit
MIGAAPPKTLCSSDARVTARERVCREHVALDLALPTFPPSHAGQFVQLLCRPLDEPAATLRDWPTDGFPSLSDTTLRGPQAFLRRPFSLADRDTGNDGRTRLRIISRTIGPGTHWLEHLHPGDTLNLTGPLGSGFRIPAAPVPLVLIGGGVGIPPLLYLTRRLRELRFPDVTVIFGATTRDLLPLRLTVEPARDGTPRPCVQLPADAAFPAIITTDDGSAGLRGLVSDGLQAWHQQTGRASQDAIVLACGPERMLAAVARLTRTLGLGCQLCIERNMGCGVGTCLSCVVRVRDDARPEHWRWALACTDGPVFDRDELLDYAGDAGT